MTKFFGNGRLAFTVASLLTILVAVLHTLGLMNEPYNEDWAAAEDAMRAATVPMGSLSMSLRDVFVGAWIQVGVLLGLVGLKNLVLLSALPEGTAVVRRMSLVDGIVCAGLAGLFTVILVPPPLISFALLAIAFFVAAATARSAESSSN